MKYSFNILISHSIYNEKYTHIPQLMYDTRIFWYPEKRVQVFASWKGLAYWLVSEFLIYTIGEELGICERSNW